MHRKLVTPATTRRRQRKAEAFISFVKSVQCPLRPTPIDETQRERRVRLLENVLKRIELYEKGGLLQGEQHRTHWWEQHRLERTLLQARWDVRMERGDI